MTTSVEFAVEMRCDSCVNEVKATLSALPGVEDVNVLLDAKTVVVKSSLPVALVQERIESTGRKAIIKGYGGLQNGEVKTNNVQSAVAMLGGECGYSDNKIRGVIRFVQMNDDECIVDGTVDGLSTGLHGLHVHELGDISDGCNRVGNHFSIHDAPHGAPDNDIKLRHTGDLGNIQVNENGRADFRFADKVLKVWDVIGRTVVITEKPDDLGRGNNRQSLIDGNCGKRLACGIIARSASMFENSKKICACDGLTLWDERDKPLAGPGRRNDS